VGAVGENIFNDEFLKPKAKIREFWKKFQIFPFFIFFPFRGEGGGISHLLRA